MGYEDPFWYTCWAANDANRLDEISDAIGFPVVGIANEQAGIIAYAGVRFADKLVTFLNMAERTLR
jgi:hypothetical protein